MYVHSPLAPVRLSGLPVCMRASCLKPAAPQTGVGRTGKVWGYQNFDVEPDVITSAKVREVFRICRRDDRKPPEGGVGVFF